MGFDTSKDQDVTEKLKFNPHTDNICCFFRMPSILQVRHRYKPPITKDPIATRALRTMAMHGAPMATAETPMMQPGTETLGGSGEAYPLVMSK